MPHITPSSVVRPGTIDVGMALYLNETVDQDAIPDDDDATPTDQGVLGFIWRTRSVINNIGYTRKDIVDNLNKALGCMKTTFRSISEWAR